MLWGSIMFQLSTFTTCAAVESHSKRQSGGEGSGIVIISMIFITPKAIGAGRS